MGLAGVKLSKLGEKVILKDGASKEQQGSDSNGGPILVAVDFTADSQAALLWACDYAGCVNAAVVALHVIHDPWDAPGYYRKGEADPLRPMEDTAREMMDQFLAEIASKGHEVPKPYGYRKSDREGHSGDQNS